MVYSIMDKGGHHDSLFPKRLSANFCLGERLAVSRQQSKNVNTKIHSNLCPIHLRMPLFSRPLYSVRIISNFPHVLTGRFHVPNSHIGPSRLQSKRKSLTLLNDDGNVPWTDLSRKEKFVRGTRQTFNFGIIVCGATLFGGVVYILYTEVFSLDSQTSYFNTAVDRIKKDPRCIALLGDPIEITAHGLPVTNNQWNSKPFVSSSRTDENGNKHLYMRFNVVGPKDRGFVYVDLLKGPSDSKYSFQCILLVIDGKPLVFVVNTLSFNPSKKFKLFGVTWR